MLYVVVQFSWVTSESGCLFVKKYRVGQPAHPCMSVARLARSYSLHSTHWMRRANTGWLPGNPPAPTESKFHSVLSLPLPLAQPLPLHVRTPDGHCVRHVPRTKILMGASVPASLLRMRTRALFHDALDQSHQRTGHAQTSGDWRLELRQVRSLGQAWRLGDGAAHKE